MLKKIPWPVPALLIWGSAWALFGVLQSVGLTAWAALALTSAMGVGLSVLAPTWWRRAMIGLGLAAAFDVAAADLPAERLA